MTLLAPRLGVLDETDSGLDIDALRIVADGVNALRGPESRRSWSSPTISGCSSTSSPTSSTSWRGAASSRAAAPSWRSSSSATAIATTPPRLRERAMTAAPAIARTAAELGLAEQFRASPGAAASPARAAAFRRFETAGLPTRRVEVLALHRSARRAGESRAARRAARRSGDRRGQGSARQAAAPRAGAARARQRRLRRRAFRSRRRPASRSAQPPASPAIFRRRPDVGAQRSRWRRPASRRPSRRARSRRRSRSSIASPARAPRAVYSRLAIDVGADASAAFVERFVGAGAETQRHASTSIDVAAGGALAHVAAIEDEPGLHVESEVVRLAERAALDAFGFVAGGALVRRQIFARLVGEEARIGAGRPRPARRTPPRRHDARSRARRAARREPRVLPPHRRRRGDRRVPGQGDRPAGRAEDRRRR